MEKKSRKNEQPDRRQAKDRGDDIKKHNEKRNETKNKVQNPERGDSDRKLQKINEKFKPSSQIEVKREPNSKSGEFSTILQKKGAEKEPRKDNQNRNNVEENKFRENITYKLRNNLLNLKKDEKLVTSKSELRTDRNPKKRPIEETEKVISPKDISDDEKLDGIKRKPLIKTITSKNEAKIYKAVTFVDQKQTPTELKISIPSTITKKSRIPKLVDKSLRKTRAGSKVSIGKPIINRVKPILCREKVILNRVKPIYSQEKVIKPILSREKPVLSGELVLSREKQVLSRKKAERKLKKKKLESPEASVLRDDASLPTEVAKWAPSSINRHTKPYYEAWVNTTLAAISKCSKKDKLFFEKQNILKTFQRALERRPDSPELVYEDLDERYTGKIKIRQRV